MIKRYYYDLHIHSCLSPCADNDSTPYNIAGTGALAGLQVMALTDHNTCRNCPPFFSAAEKYGIIPIAGMELTTSEDIHMICLFPTLDSAMRFDGAVAKRRVLIENKPDIFGEQLITNENDEVICTEKFLLTNATSISVNESIEIAHTFGGICYPAHIDREANGIISILGAVPKELHLTCAELHDCENAEKYARHLPNNCHMIFGSDAHYLWDIRDGKHFLELDDTQCSAQLVREFFINFLGGKR